MVGQRRVVRREQLLVRRNADDDDSVVGEVLLDQRAQQGDVVVDVFQHVEQGDDVGTPDGPLRP